MSRRVWPPRVPGEPLRTFSVSEILALPLAPLASGRVKLNKTRPMSIDFDTGIKGLEPYWIRVDVLDTDREVLKFIAQLHHKTWCTDEMMRDFLELLDRLDKFHPGRALPPRPPLTPLT